MSVSACDELQFILMNPSLEDSTHSLKRVFASNLQEHHSNKHFPTETHSLSHCPLFHRKFAKIVGRHGAKTITDGGTYRIPRLQCPLHRFFRSPANLANIFQ